MKKRYKISVVMITYNGEKYIEEQLNSILNQTVKPDEIIISDDGSTDETIDLINGINSKQNGEVSIIVLTDNPIHGISTNCSWAIQHTTGDIVFITGQDDVWALNKVEKTLSVYVSKPDAKMVISNAYLIDGQSHSYPGEFCTYFISSLGSMNEGEIVKINRSTFIENVESGPLVSGPVLSLKRSIVDLIVPIAPHVLEDQWMEFVGLAEDSLYYQNDKLTYYRIHNSSTHTEGLSILQKFSKNYNRIKTSFVMPFYSYNIGIAMRSYYNHHPAYFEGRDAAIDTVNHIIRIGEREISYMRMGRLKGAHNLIKMYKTDIRYRKSGKQAFVISLLYILLFSKKRRNRDIDNELAKSSS